MHLSPAILALNNTCSKHVVRLCCIQPFTGENLVQCARPWRRPRPLPSSSVIRDTRCAYIHMQVNIYVCMNRGLEGALHVHENRTRTRSQVVLEHVGPEFGLYYLSATLVRGGITSCAEHALPTAARARCSLGSLIALMLCFCGTALPGQVPLAGRGRSPTSTQTLLLALGSSEGDRRRAPQVSHAARPASAVRRS